MPNYASLPVQSRRALHVFYVLDTSGSMKGLPIQRLNRAMGETLDALRQVAYHNANAQIKVAVLQFHSNCSWMQPAGPEDADDFIWEDMAAAGMTNVGAALDELNSKMQKDEFLKSSTGALMPVVIFMTDGYATDDYDAALERAMRNPSFRGATKIGFAIGDDPDTNMITKLVGTPEAVIRTDDLGLFANLLRFVSEGASLGASVARPAGGSYTGAQAVSEALKRMGATKEGDGITVVEQALGVAPIPDAGGHAWEDFVE